MCKYIFLLVLMLLLIGGCEDSSSRMTDAQLERRAVTQKIELVEAAGGFVLMVGGETLTSDEIIETRTQINGMFASPTEYFGPIAQANELEQFKERAKGRLEEILMLKSRIFYSISTLKGRREGILTKVWKKQRKMSTENLFSTLEATRPEPTMNLNEVRWIKRAL